MDALITPKPKTRMTHPYTYIDPNARIAPNVKIDPFTVIHGDVKIGEGTWIGSNVTIMDGTRIGKNCRIFPGAVLGAIPQDLKFSGEKTTVEVGDNTTIREFVTINRGTEDRGKTKVGSNCLIMAYSHIAHDCLIGNNCVLSNNNNSPSYLPIPNNISSNSTFQPPSLFIRNKNIVSNCKINVYDVKYKTIGTGTADSCSTNNVGCPTKGIRNSVASTSLYATYDLYSTVNGVYNPIPSQEGPCGIPSIAQSINTFSEITTGPKREGFVTGFDTSACQSMDENQCVRSMQSNANAINQAYQTSTLNNIEVNQKYNDLNTEINSNFAPLYNKVNNNPQYNSIDQDGTLTQNKNGRKTLLNGMIEDTKDNLIRQNTNYILINICAAIFLVGFFTFVPE